MTGEQERVNPTGSLQFRVETLEDHDKETRETVKTNSTLVQKHELEIYGERGINVALRQLDARLVWVNRALWTIAGSVVAGSVLIVLQLASSS